ncbi:hypothetical protein ABZ371_14925 [Streptomyces sp. NPDC005899]|uniref:hypothetical protein n=1 Tax=Streptomyces sp. NPDC005899 TaxID=3155716 RepID=UPI0033CEB789
MLFGAAVLLLLVDIEEQRDPFYGQVLSALRTTLDRYNRPAPELGFSPDRHLPDPSLEGMALAALLALMGCVFLLRGRMEDIRRLAFRRRRASFIPAYCASLVLSCAELGSASFEQRKQLLTRIDRTAGLLQIELAGLSVHVTRRRNSPRKTAIDQHAKLVAAALLRQVEQLDSQPTRAAENVAELAIHICERYSHGLVGALLDPARLAGLTPVTSHENLRLASAVILTGATIVGISYTGLPAAPVAVVGSGLGLLIFRSILGPRSTSLDLFDSMRGIQRP